MADFWTDDKIETLRAMHRDGHTCREIGMVVGATRNAVIGKLHRLGISKPSAVDHWTAERLATLRTMHVEGASYEEIAEATGFCVGSCRTKASRIGLASRGNIHYRQPRSTNKPRGFRPRLVEGLAAPSTDHAVGILDVTGCKWAVTPDNCDKGGHLFCNHQVDENSPYCAYHAELNRAKPVPRGEFKRSVIPTSLLRAVA